MNTESLLKLTHIIWLYYGQVNNWKENGTRPNKINKVQHRSRIIKTAARWNIFKTRNVLYLCNGLGQIVNRLEALRSTIQFSGVVCFTPLEILIRPKIDKTKHWSASRYTTYTCKFQIKSVFFLCPFQVF